MAFPIFPPRVSQVPRKYALLPLISYDSRDNAKGCLPGIARGRSNQPLAQTARPFEQAQCA